MDTAASDLTGHLYASLTLAERLSSLRQTDSSWLGLRTDARRGAAALSQWKSLKPFTVADQFERRLRLDGLTEEYLLAVLGLPAEAYSELFPTSPEWVRELQRLYSTDRSPVPDGDPLLQWTQHGTNGFVWIAYPLIQEGLRRFREAVQQLSSTTTPFDLVTVEPLVLPNLLAVLKPMVEKAMVLELNIARVRGLLKGKLPEQRFRNFCDALRDPEARWSFVRDYPVLFRSLYVRTINWVDYTVELLSRLSKDWDLIRESLVLGLEPERLTAISPGAGDDHRRGRTVAILEFSSGVKLVYKPRSLSLDVHFGEFLEWVNESGFEPPFRSLTVIDRGGYGWSEYVAHQPCSSPGGVERFYQRLGGYLAVFYALKANDMHFDNLIAAGEFPVPVDLETLFHPVVNEAEDPAANAWRSSVLRVLLLPTRILWSETQEGVDISGLGGRSGQYYPAGTVDSWDRIGTDEMRLIRDEPVPMAVGDNRPTLDGQDVSLEEFVEAFVAGFTRVYRLLDAHKKELQVPGGILDRFAEDKVRYVGRPTSTYGTLLTKAFYPDILRDAFDRDQLFDHLWLGAGDQPHLTQLIAAELQDLHCGDVPAFTTRPNSRDLWTSSGERIAGFFEQPAIEGVRQGLCQLGEEDLALQTWFIRAAIASAGDVLRPTSAAHQLSRWEGADSMELARAVGDALCRRALEYGAYASWIGLTPAGSAETSWCLQPLDISLHAGLSGCSFFLAYLGVLTGDTAYSTIARKSINLVRRQLERQRAGGLPILSLGGFSGSGGIIYTLAHLGVLWQDDLLIDEALSLAADVPSAMETDQSLDVVGGSAGTIAALGVLNAVSPSDRLLDIAVLCGEHLLDLQQPQNTGGAWQTDMASSQPLTGFSHGAAGIAWALLRLAGWSKDARFRNAAETAIAYERSTFVTEESNWPDFRRRSHGPDEVNSKPRFCIAWCHGAAGIAMARLDNLPYMDDRATREEIGIALRKTVESGFGIDSCLCHGDFGNLDILTFAEERIGAPWIHIRKRLMADTLARLAKNGVSEAQPGLMVGLAGIGYGLLRLACPERVPSMLVLAPPLRG